MKTGGGDLMKVDVAPEAKPVLAEWRGNDKGYHLVLTDGLESYDVDKQLSIMLSMAAFAIAAVVFAAPKANRKRMSKALVKEVFSFAEQVLRENKDEVVRRDGTSVLREKGGLSDVG